MGAWIAFVSVKSPDKSWGSEHSLSGLYLPVVWGVGHCMKAKRLRIRHFLYCCDQYPARSNLKEKGLSLSWVENVGGRVEGASEAVAVICWGCLLISQQTRNQSAKCQWKLNWLPSFPLFIDCVPNTWVGTVCVQNPSLSSVTPV